MKLGKISSIGMDNLMSTVRELGIPPEQVIKLLLEDPSLSLEEAKRLWKQQKIVTKS